MQSENTMKPCICIHFLVIYFWKIDSFEKSDQRESEVDLKLQKADISTHFYFQQMAKIK